MARRKDVVQPEISEEQAVSTSEENAKPSKRQFGVYVPWTESGELDQSRIRTPEQREKLEKARAALGVSQSNSVAIPEAAGMVTEDHVKYALGFYGPICATGVNVLINPKLRVASKPEISRDLALRCFTLTPDQIDSLAPDGAAALNKLVESMPDWLKEFLFSVGPGAKFCGQLAFITYMQFRMMQDLYNKQNPMEQPAANDIPVEVKPN